MTGLDNAGDRSDQAPLGVGGTGPPRPEVDVTRKLDPGLGADEARADVRALRAWQPIPVAETTLDAAWTIEDEYGFAFWDALIVATAKAGRCDVLLTEDLQHDQLVDDIRVLSPFRTAPFALDD